jgi:hypothetical protein
LHPLHKKYLIEVKDVNENVADSREFSRCRLEEIDGKLEIS